MAWDCSWPLVAAGGPVFPFASKMVTSAQEAAPGDRGACLPMALSRGGRSLRPARRPVSCLCHRLTLRPPRAGSSGPVRVQPCGSGGPVRGTETGRCDEGAVCEQGSLCARDLVHTVSNLSPRGLYYGRVPEEA